jgi:O-6-methylguanine DNA methyltransferase
MKTFADKVRNVVRKIPKGKSMTYKEVAARAGNPKAARAVGAIMLTNYDESIPCHRVIRSDGSLGSYNRGGTLRKQAMLKSEGAFAASGLNKISDEVSHTTPEDSRHKKRLHHHIEHIDYLKTGRRSIWGLEDPKTVEVINTLRVKGAWLHLTAGDGRCNALLLRTVNSLIASDIDPNALEKSLRNISRKYKRKFTTKVFDVARRFPIVANSMDGVFCVGTLHIFPLRTLKHIASEIDRVLKPNGTALIDFATDIKRDRFDGKPYVIPGEKAYTNQSAERMLNRLFRGYATRFWRSRIPRESYSKANPPYHYESKFLIMRAIKSHQK